MFIYEIVFFTLMMIFFNNQSKILLILILNPSSNLTDEIIRIDRLILDLEAVLGFSLLRQRNRLYMVEKTPCSDEVMLRIFR